MKKALTIAKINFRQSKLTYLIVAIVCGSNIISTFIQLLAGVKDNYDVSVGNLLFLVVILSAVFIPTLHFKKIMHLNGKRLDFVKGTFMNYLTFSAITAIINNLVFSIFNKWLVSVFNSDNITFYDIVEIFGWNKNGVLLSTIQLFAFLVFVSAAIHTLTVLQTSWKGWLIDITIITILAVGIPISALRIYLVGFFYFIIFINRPFTQISIYILSAVIMYFINLKVIFNRKI